MCSRKPEKIRSSIAANTVFGVEIDLGLVPVVVDALRCVHSSLLMGRYSRLRRAAAPAPYRRLARHRVQLFMAVLYFLIVVPYKAMMAHRGEIVFGDPHAGEGLPGLLVRGSPCWSVQMQVLRNRTAFDCRGLSVLRRSVAAPWLW